MLSYSLPVLKVLYRYSTVGMSCFESRAGCSWGSTSSSLGEITVSNWSTSTVFFSLSWKAAMLMCCVYVYVVKVYFVIATLGKLVDPHCSMLVVWSTGSYCFPGAVWIAHASSVCSVCSKWWFTKLAHLLWSAPKALRCVEQLVGEAKQLLIK